MGKRWFVVRTRWAKEAQAGVEIAKLGIPVLIPMAYKMRKEGKWMVPEPDGPLFPRYIFAAFNRHDATCRWPEIYKARGVVRILSDKNNDPVPVPYKVIRAIRWRNREPKKARFESKFRDGQRVKALAGPFTSFEGIAQASAKDRVRVLLSIFGREIPVEFEDKDLEAA